MSFLLAQDHVATSILLVTLLGGYLSGSVPYGLILTRMAGLGDLRQVGSGNIGATNVLRMGNKKIAALTLLLDALKGLIPVLIAKQIHMDYAILTAIGAFVGHLFPVWLKFKGGKGVATALGIFLALWWQLGVCIICVWLITAIITRYSSAAALMAFGLSPILAAILTHHFQIIAFSILITLVLWARHHENIKRLYLGTEGKINLNPKKKAA